MSNIIDRKPKLWQRLAALTVIAGLVALDQVIKRWAEEALAPGGARDIVPRVLGLHYSENTGISFSMFGDSAIAMRVVACLTGLVMLGGLAALLTGKIDRGAALWSVSLILAGGIGNLIDRVAQGYVVDYLEFLFVRFAVFNFADVCITCGVVWLAGRIMMGESRKRKAVAP